MKKFYYILSLVTIFTVPTLVEFVFLGDRVKFFDVLAFSIGISVIGSLWDIWATQHGKKDAVWLWSFNNRNTLGIKFLDVPIEEYLFYLATSTYIIFTWELIKFASESSRVGIWYLLGSLTAWSIGCILLPYYFRPKNDIV